MKNIVKTFHIVINILHIALCICTSEYMLHVCMRRRAIPFINANRNWIFEKRIHTKENERLFIASLE